MLSSRLLHTTCRAQTCLHTRFPPCSTAAGPSKRVGRLRGAWTDLGSRRSRASATPASAADQQPSAEAAGERPPASKETSKGPSPPEQKEEPPEQKPPPGQSAEEQGPYPADLDAQRFKLDPSVARWQGYSGTFRSGLMTNNPSSSSPGAAALQEALSRLLRAAGSSTSNSTTGGLDAQGAAYWAYHMTRFGFFSTQAAAGLLAHHASETLGSSSSSSSSSGTSTPMTRILSNGMGELAFRLNEAVGTWEQDYSWISTGNYRMPWDMVTPNRQYNPLFLLNRTAAFVDEGVATLRRRVRGSPDPAWLRGSPYPEYYAQGFHYQTDGWLSSRSASIYDHSTEVLFVGRQDAMQRCALVPISDYIATSPIPVREMKLLEVAAGTGRFHSFIKDNHPDLPSIVSDLSPFYLQQARRKMREWKRVCQPSRGLGGIDDTGVLEYVQSRAEALDMPDASVEIVLSVYLFHELPEQQRAEAAAEMFRVLKPGGLAVFCDSVQLNDRPEWNPSMANFRNFQEPNYPSYIAADIGGMFMRQGFVPRTKYVNSATKVLSFIKPA